MTATTLPRATVRRTLRRQRHTRPPAGRPDPERLARAVTRAILEVEAGRRPIDQLRGLLAPMVYLELAGRVRGAGAVRSRQPKADATLARIVSSRTHQPTPDTAEVCVLVDTGNRVTAFAVRVDHHRGAWRVTDFGQPDDGRPGRKTGSVPA